MQKLNVHCTLPSADMYPDSYPGDVGEEMNSPELKLSSDTLRASVTLSGDIFSHGLGAGSL